MTGRLVFVGYAAHALPAAVTRHGVPDVIYDRWGEAERRRLERGDRVVFAAGADKRPEREQLSEADIPVEFIEGWDG